MENLVDYIRSRFSGYTVGLFILCSIILLFIDSRELRQNDLNREALFSTISGIVYALIAVLGIILSRI